MKMYQFYVCEHCGRCSLNYDEIDECEASHVGLTANEKRVWDVLKSAVKYFGSVMSKKNNEYTRASYDVAVEKLISFEKLHGM